MTLKKESLFNRFLIELVILLSKVLNFFDFKLKSIFIFFNIVICSYFLFFYVKPLLDEKFSENINISHSNEIKLNSDLDNIKQKSMVLTEAQKILITQPSTNLIYTSSLPVSAKSYIVYDVTSSRELFNKAGNLTLPPASLVKMLSVLYFFDNINLEKEYTVFSECNLVDGQRVGYKNGEKVSGKDLLYSSLIFSAGDSICNMYKITGSELSKFNDFSKELGMKNSNFTNFIGLDYPGNYTTSEDLLILTKSFIKNELFNQIVATKSYKMRNGKVVYNTNRMLFENEYSVGIKTGTTIEAKENLIYRYKNANKNMDVIIILLNSSSRYQDVKNILNSLIFK